MMEVGAAASIASLANVALRVFAALYQYYSDVKSAPTHSMELREELGVLIGVFENFKIAIAQGKKLETSRCSGIEKAIPLIQKLLETMEGKIDADKTKGLNRAKWPFKKEENKHYIERLERFKLTMSIAIGIEQS
jgi:Fungal N-terminal domain of STAND proteins